MTTLLLVAAALTPAQRRAEFGGDHDLDEGGRRAAENLAPAFTRTGPWTAAPSKAARQTATALGGTPATTTAALADVDYGDWTGHTLDQIDPTGWLTDPAFTPPGGESLTAVRHRVGTWLDAHAGQTLVAVAHTTVLRAALAHALDLPPDGIWRLDIAPLTTLPLTHRAGRWHLRLAPPAYMRR